MGPGGLATPNRAGVCGRPPTTRPLLTVREDGGVYSPSLRSRAVRLPPTPCRVCFRPCVFNRRKSSASSALREENKYLLTYLLKYRKTRAGGLRSVYTVPLCPYRNYLAQLGPNLPRAQAVDAAPERCQVLRGRLRARWPLALPLPIVGVVRSWRARPARFRHRGSGAGCATARDARRKNSDSVRRELTGGWSPLPRTRR